MMEPVLALNEAPNINIAFARIKASGTTIRFNAYVSNLDGSITLLSVFRASGIRPNNGPVGNLIFFYC
jgi:hypothetical protein